MLEIRWLIRSIHILSATAWIGGSLMYQLVVIPALHQHGPAPALATRIAQLFKRIVNICIGTLLLSGAYLTFDRLTQTTLGLSYIIVLGLKIVIALLMFVLAIYLGQSNIRRLAKRSSRFSQAAPQLLLALGILVFVLGALLNNLFEVTIAPH